MKGIIVPGVTDMNKGDQALVWESHRVAMDTGLFEKVFILSNGDTPEEREKLCAQSERRGFDILENILKHPRRGKHHQGEVVREGIGSLLRLVVFAVYDFCQLSLLLSVCNNRRLVGFLFDKKTVSTVNTFRNSDVIFIKGGGFIHAYGEKTAPYLIWYFLFYVRLARAMRKKIIFLPNSFGPFEGLTVKSQVRSVFKSIDRIYAREALSSSKLGSLLNRNIPVSPDLGFYLSMADVTNANALLDKYRISQDDKIVGITIRPWRFPGHSDPERLYENYLSSVVALVNHVLSLGYTVAFCNQSIGPNTHEDDRNAIREVMKRVSHQKIVWIDEDLPCDVLKALYSRFYAFVGTRFHSVIFSLTSCVPSIAIGYGGNKAKGIMADFNLDDFTVPIESVSSEKLTLMFDKLAADHDRVRNILSENNRKLSEKRTELIADIAKAIAPKK